MEDLLLDVLLSLSHKFLFVHIPKTGGNSIQNVLRAYSVDQIVRLNPLQDGIERFEIRNPIYGYHKHSTLREYKAILGQTFVGGLFKFACIRNPWERVISFYFSPHRQVTQWNRGDFIRFIEEVPPMVCYLEQTKGLSKDDPVPSRLGVNLLLRFERLREDFDLACNKVGIPNQPLPHRNRSIRGHYAQYYDSELVDLVARKFADDIECFGYRFDDD